jgi:hypothetical protein
MTMSIPVGKVLTIGGLLCDLGGVWLLTISTILGKHPLRRWLQLREIDPEDLKDGDAPNILDFDTDVDPTGNIDEIETTSNRDRLLKRERNRVFSVVLLGVGFLLQILGSLA